MTLAANGISTAADIHAHAISNIKGFGTALTANLLAWQEDVERTFRFDPARAISPGEHRALAVRYRTRQQQLLFDAEQKLAALAAFAPGCKAEVQSLVGGLNDAVAAFEQAHADLALFRRKA
jgi:DNA-binding helix-hairpin-helix protein with protein kinase domain